MAGHLEPDVLCLSLVVSFSNGTTSTFGGAYFTPSADGISFDGGSIGIGIGDGAALRTGAVLSGVLAPIDAALFDGQVDHFLAAFGAQIAVRSGGLSDGDLAVIDASTAPVSTVPEPGIGWLSAAGLLPFVAGTRSRRPRASKVRPESAAAPAQWPRTLSIAAASQALAVPSLAAVKLNSWSAPSSGVAGKTLVNLTATGISVQPNEMPQGVAVSFAESCGASTISSTAASSVTTIVPTSIRIQVPLPMTLTARTYAVSVTGTTSAGPFASGNCSLVNVALRWTTGTLIASNWSTPPHSEGYVCRIIVVQSDMYTAALRADSAPYLAIVTVADNSTNPYSGADFPCSAGSTFARGVFMAGPGTGELTMPAGVAVHVRPGQFLSISTSSTTLIKHAPGPR